MPKIKRYSKNEKTVTFYSEQHPSIIIGLESDGSFLFLEIKNRIFKKMLLTRDQDLTRFAAQTRYGIDVLNNSYIISKYPNIFTLTKMNKIQLFKKLTIENDLTTEHFIEIFGNLEIHKHVEDENDSDIEKVNNFTVFFPSKMRKSSRDSFKRILLDLHNIYKKHGLEKVATGEVRFTSLPARKRGLYFIKTDDIRINSSGDSDLQLLYTLIHECAHRLMYKFIPNKTGEIIKIFNEKQMNVKINRELPFKVGDEFTSNDKKYKGKYKIQSITDKNVVLLSIPTEKFTLTVKSPPDHLKKAKSGFYKIVEKISSTQIVFDGPYFKFDLPIDRFLTSDLFNIPKDIRNQNVLQLDNASDAWKVANFKSSLKFPTKYSETDYSEWFAECVTLYMVNSLEGDIKKIIENLIK